MWFDSLKTYVLLDKPGIREISLNAFGKFIEESIKSLKSEADVAKKSTVLEVPTVLNGFVCCLILKNLR